VWLTLNSAAATSPAVLAYPEAPRLFVIDPEWMAAERPSLNRLLFLFACLADVPRVEVLLGDPREILPARAASHGCDGLVLTETPCPQIRRAATAIQAGEAGTERPLPVTFLSWPRFCDRSGVSDLGRFSRYWQKVQTSAMKPTQAS
jgi:deoxyribodipyrimidine photo-lyase